VQPGDGRGRGHSGNPVRDARQAAGLTIKELAAATQYKIGLLQALEDGRARATEQMAATLARALPGLDVDRLLSHHETAPALPGVEHAGAASGRDVRRQRVMPRGQPARYVPLITWAQAAQMTELGDLARHEGQIAFEAEDADAFAVTIKGDSMDPPFAPGDVAIVYPGRPAANGNLVLGRTREGELFLKRLTVLRTGEYRFSSYNAVYPAFDRAQGELAWIYPVASVHKETL
jgi:SOS-response transcriptional repressor LexA